MAEGVFNGIPWWFKIDIGASEKEPAWVSIRSGTWWNEDEGPLGASKSRKVLWSGLLSVHLDCLRTPRLHYFCCLQRTLANGRRSRYRTISVGKGSAPRTGHQDCACRPW